MRRSEENRQEKRWVEVNERCEGESLDLSGTEGDTSSPRRGKGLFVAGMVKEGKIALGKGVDVS